MDEDLRTNFLSASEFVKSSDCQLMELIYRFIL